MTRYSFCTSYSYDILHPLTKTKETTLDEKFDVATVRIDFRSLSLSRCLIIYFKGKEHFYLFNYINDLLFA